MLDAALYILAEVVVRVIGIERCGEVIARRLGGEGAVLVVFRPDEEDDEEDEDEEDDHFPDSLAGTVWDPRTWPEYRDGDEDH